MRLPIISAVFVLLSLTVPAAAAYHPPVEARALPSGALVRVNRRTVILLRRPSGNTPPAERAMVLAERLDGAVQAGLLPGAVRVRRVEGRLALFAGEAELVRPTAADARAAGTTARRLAYQWANTLRQTLALAPLTVSAPSLLIPFGESRAVRVGGVAAGPLALEPRDPSVAAAEAVGDGRSVCIRAGQPGQTVVAIAAHGAVVGVRVVVKKYAGEAMASVTVDCTGRPAPSELVRALVMESYPRALRLEPGAWARLTGKPRLPASLSAGEEGWARVPVRLAGPGLLPRQATAQVHVRCRRLPPRDANALLYSNDPERIARPARLYVGEVEPNAPCRLLYHHQNVAGQPLILRVDLINPEEAPAEAQVVDGVAAPMVDTVLAGHRAGARYLRNAVRDVGRVYTVPGRSRVPLLRQRLAPGYTASGLYGLRSLNGQRLLVEVRAERPAAVDPAFPQPDAVALVQHVYPNPRRVMEASYTCGKSWTFLRVGKLAIPGKDGQQKLDGNYGVLYDISVRLDNPLPQARVVRLVLAPDAGGAQGVFLVEGKWVEAPHLAPPAEFELAQFLLSPQEHRVVNIRTLPVGGSAYPVTLVVR
jgi:hypothetical protein